MSSITTSLNTNGQILHLEKTTDKPREHGNIQSKEINPTGEQDSSLTPTQTNEIDQNAIKKIEMAHHADWIKSILDCEVEKSNQKRKSEKSDKKRTRSEGEEEEIKREEKEKNRLRAEKQRKLKKQETERLTRDNLSLRNRIQLVAELDPSIIELYEKLDVLNQKGKTGRSKTTKTQPKPRSLEEEQAYVLEVKEKHRQAAAKSYSKAQDIRATLIEINESSKRQLEILQNSGLISLKHNP